MASNKSEKTDLYTENTIKQFFDQLRDPNGGKEYKVTRTFKDVVVEHWSRLDINLSEEETNAASLDDTKKVSFIENLLIKAICESFLIEEDQSNTQNRNNAKNRDFFLLSFGLIKGYYHTEKTPDGDRTIGHQEKYHRYLSTDILVKLEYPDYQTYANCLLQTRGENARRNSEKKESKQQPAPLNCIESAYSHKYKTIAKKFLDLIKTGDYEDCKSAATINEETGVRVDLPELCFTLEKYSPLGKPTTQTREIGHFSPRKDENGSLSDTKRHFSQRHSENWANIEISLNPLRLEFHINFSCILTLCVMIVILYGIYQLPNLLDRFSSSSDTDNTITTQVQETKPDDTPIEIVPPSFDDRTVSKEMEQP